MGCVFSKPAEIAIGAFAGGAAAELMKPVIEEAKKVLAFKSVSKELASTMESLVPILEKIDSAEDVVELKDLKVTIGKAQVLVKKCAGVWWWNVFLKNYYTRKVEKIDRKMLKFCQIDLQLIQLMKQLKSNDNFASWRLCSVRELDMVPVGLELPLGVLRSKLLVLRNKSVNTLLVYAPPGCGKTTLVTQICHDETIKREFKHIFFSVVSSAPDFIKLVQDLLKHNGDSPSSFANNSQAIVALKTLLVKLRKSGPILWVLDDVWHGSDFLLKNFQNNILGYKILVTSRDNLLDYDFTYELKPLEADYAKTLLIKSAPRPDDASQADYDDLIQKILKRCSGFPLVIEVVGSSLKGKPKYVWEGQVDSWSLGETVLNNPHDRVLKCLEPSFTFLTSPLQECFMDMGSFLEDQKIRASVIIDIWVELYGKGSSTSSNVYMKYLNDLASRSLLKLIPLGRKEPEDGFYNEFEVTQHDVLRELAIRQSEVESISKRKRLNLEIRENTFPDWCLDLKNPIKARLLSISTDDLFSSKWIEMDCPNVEALILHISSSDYALPEFISTMMKLKIVIIINHGFHPVRVSNVSCLNSLPNLKRIRMDNISFTFEKIIMLQWINLKKLALFRCIFDTKDIVDVCLPSLEEIDIDYCDDLVELPSWIFEVISLKTLSITNCNKLSKLPESIGNLRNLETLRLSSCNSLFELPATVWRLRNLHVSGCYLMLPPEEDSDEGLLSNRVARFSEESRGSGGDMRRRECVPA